MTVLVLLCFLLDVAYPLRKLLQSVLVNSVLILQLCGLVSTLSELVYVVSHSPCCLRELACDEA
jgi:hypothetical protein